MILLFALSIGLAASQGWTDVSGNDNGWGVTGDSGVPAVHTPTSAPASSSSGKVAYFTAPEGGESSGSLIDESTPSGVAAAPAIQYEMIGGSSPNAFWIICQCGSFMKQMDLPYGMYARVLAQPAVSGPLVLYEQYPSGDTRTYNLGWVYAQHNYRMWFRADAYGTHLVTYRVGGSEASQTLTFNVY